MVRDSIQTLFARMFTILGRLAYSIIINRALGPLGKGYFEVIQVVPGILYNFGLFGFDHSNVYFAGKKPEKIPSLLANSITLAITLGAVSALMGLGYYFFFEDKYSEIYAEFGRFIVWIPLVITPLHLAAVYFDGIIYGRDIIWVRNVKEIVNVFLRLLFPILFVIVFGWWVKGAIWAFICISIGLLLYSVYFILRFFRASFGRFDWGLVRESFKFGRFEFGANFASYLFYKIDILLLFFLLPAADVIFLGVNYPQKEVLIGFYTIAVTAITVKWTIPDSITTALKPKITMGGETERRRLVPPSLRVCTLTVVISMVLLALFVKPVIGFVFGDGSNGSDDWTPAAEAVYWLIPGILTLSLAKIFATDLFSRGKPYFAMWISIFSLVVNLILNFILIPRPGYYGGIIGAAIASSASYTISFILFCYFYRRESGTPFTQMFFPRKEDFSTVLKQIRKLTKLSGKSDELGSDDHE